MQRSGCSCAGLDGLQTSDGPLKSMKSSKWLRKAFLGQMARMVLSPQPVPLLWEVDRDDCYEKSPALLRQQILRWNSLVLTVRLLREIESSYYNQPLENILNPYCVECGRRWGHVGTICPIICTRMNSKVYGFAVATVGFGWKYQCNCLGV